jgi:Dullard-like phosphatase family protein
MSKLMFPRIENQLPLAFFSLRYLTSSITLFSVACKVVQFPIGSCYHHSLRGGQIVLSPLKYRKDKKNRYSLFIVLIGGKTITQYQKKKAPNKLSLPRKLASTKPASSDIDILDMRIESESVELRRRPSQDPLLRLQRARSAERPVTGSSPAMDIIPTSTVTPTPTLSPSAKALAKGPSLPPLSPKPPQLSGNGEPMKPNYHPAISNLSETASGASAPKKICVEHDGPSTQTESSNAGKDARVSSLVPNSFGLQVKARYLTKVQALRKSVSPFVAEQFIPMLKPCPKAKVGKTTLALDIDETLVHASINPRPGLHYDTVVRIDDGPHSGNIYVAFRPHLHTFLRAVAPLFEVVVFTASQSCYADPLMDTIDPDKTLVTDRLYRQHCVDMDGGRIKDLNLCGRSLDRMMIIDNSPIAYCFQPRNAIPILSWFDDPNDDELLKLIPLLQQLATEESVYPFLDMYNAHLLSAQEEVNCGSPINLFRRR